MLKKNVLLPTVVLCGLIVVFAIGCASSKNKTVTIGTEEVPSGMLSLIDKTGSSKYVIYVSPKASVAEKHAANELANYLKKISSVDFKITNIPDSGNKNLLVVGPDAALKVCPNWDLSGLGQDGIIIKTVGDDLILTGGFPSRRGTLYAVYTLLEDTFGCHWWSPKESTIPENKRLTVPKMNIRYRPPFEYREIFVYDVFDPNWAIRNKCNGYRYHLDAKRGGGITYAQRMFVHTFSRLVPKNVAKRHPEWFSKIDGKRKVFPLSKTQFCLTNPELLSYCVKRVKEILSESQSEVILSVSQNDNNNHCQCAKCAKVNEEEGSPSGALIKFVNKIAGAVKKEYPEAKIDTLAYRWTVRPPRHVRPLDNVIVRLCRTGGVSYFQSLNDLGNADFAKKLKKWSKITNNLFVWDYICDFNHILLPFPDMLAARGNLEFLADNKVKGVFEQGFYKGVGSEMAIMRSWLLAKYLWNPKLDEKKLKSTFLRGYYGPAAKYIKKYVDLIHDAAKASGGALDMYYTANVPFLNAETIAEAEQVLDEAVNVVKGAPELERRVAKVRLSVIYTIIENRGVFNAATQISGKKVVFKKEYNAYLKEFIRSCEYFGIKYMGEPHNSTLANFKKTHPFLDKQTKAAVTPEFLKKYPRNHWFELQEGVMSIHGFGSRVFLKHDSVASNGVAALMTTNHKRWDIQLSVPTLPTSGDDIWDVYVAARVDSGGGEKNESAFKTGIYDVYAKKRISSNSVSIAKAKGEKYNYVHAGATRLNRKNTYVWVAPVNNPEKVAGILVDRIIFVKRDVKP